jgi:hypothetical protein
MADNLNASETVLSYLSAIHDSSAESLPYKYVIRVTKLSLEFICLFCKDHTEGQAKLFGKLSFILSLLKDNSISKLVTQTICAMFEHNRYLYHIIYSFSCVLSLIT